MAVLDVTEMGFSVVEMAPEVTREALIAATQAELIF
jgi:acyl CoA:acetate/3-ketoacid CoA transferase beta subunit